MTTQSALPSSFRPAARLMYHTAGVALAALALAAPAAAAMYKWTDTAGRVVYSDQPPMGNVKVEVVGNAPAPANSNAVKELANKEADFKKRQMDQAEAVTKDDKARAEAARTQTYCMQVKSQIIGLQESQVAIYRLNEKGERVMMGDAERKAEIDKLDRALRERNCPR